MLNWWRGSCGSLARSAGPSIPPPIPPGKGGGGGAGGSVSILAAEAKGVEAGTPTAAPWPPPWGVSVVGPAAVAAAAGWGLVAGGTPTPAGVCPRGPSLAPRILGESKAKGVAADVPLAAGATREAGEEGGAAGSGGEMPGSSPVGGRKVWSGSPLPAPAAAAAATAAAAAAALDPVN